MLAQILSLDAADLHHQMHQFAGNLCSRLAGRNSPRPDVEMGTENRLDRKERNKTREKRTGDCRVHRASAERDMKEAEKLRETVEVVLGEK
jgi:hypothetical protein